MPYLIDGNNLIGRSRDLHLKSPFSRELLIKQLLAFQKKKEAKIIIVFDGAPDEHLNRHFLFLGNLEIIFAGQKSDADTRILQIIQESLDPTSFILVSSDKRLTDRARHLRAKIMKCHQFRKKLHALSIDQTDKIEPKLGKDEIEEWMEYFKNHKNRES